MKSLKDLDSKNALQGKLIHEVLENQIGQHFIGRGTNEYSAKSQYIQRLEQYRNTASKSIIEYYNGMPVNDAFFDTIRGEGIDKISMFFGVIWPQFRDLEYLKHEEFDRFTVGDVECLVKVDYVSKTRDDILVVSDWKTGSDREDYQNELQIGAYVLWAKGYYSAELEKIRSEMVYLTTGIMRQYKFTDEKIEEIRSLIVKDFDEMNETYEIESFTPKPAPWKCLGCPFASICPNSVAQDAVNW